MIKIFNKIIKKKNLKQYRKKFFDQNNQIEINRKYIFKLL